MTDPFQAADADPAASAPYPLEHAPDALSTSARLAKAERERDEARAEARDQQRRRLEVAAELATARTELEQLRAERQWIVARDGGRDCVRCEQEIRRGEAYELLPGVDELRHIHCPNPEGAPTT